MADELVTVESYSTPEEAHLALYHLESEGITACLADEELVSTAWHLGNAVGGIKLQVLQGQADKATSILAEHRSRSEEGDAAPESTESKIERAYRAAALGLIFPPLQLYSLALLGGLLSQRSTMGTGAKRRYQWAWTLNLWLLVLVFLFYKAGAN